MIEERGRVVAVEDGAVWVEVARKSTCSSCSASAGCGQGLMEKLGVGRGRNLVRALCQLHLDVGDPVVIAIREDLLVRGALLLYLLPLVGLFAAALLVQALGASEPITVISGLAGLALGLLLVRRRSQRVADNPDLQPVVLKALLATN